MDNTTTTIAIDLNTYFAKVLADEIGLLDEDRYVVAKAAFEEVPTLLRIFAVDITNEDDYCRHLNYQLGSHLSEVVFILEDLISEIPNAEVEGFITDLKDISKWKSANFLNDFKRIVGSFLTEGSKALAA